MTELVVILRDFSALGSEAGAHGQWPRLPLLESVLARASLALLPDGWRGWIAARTAPPALSEFSIASLAGAAFRDRSVTRPESTGYWLATPVHLFAGLDSVQIHPEGLLQLNDDEQSALISDFASVFSDSPWRIETLQMRELLLSGLQIDANGSDPSHFIGADPSAGLPRGESAGVLRRLGSEIEMWLHEHRVNRAREARGELSVSALWLWGAQVPAVASVPSTLSNPRLFGRDIYVEALWRLQHRTTEDESAAMAAIDAVPMQLQSDSVWLYSGGFTQLEQRVLPSLLRSLRARRLSVLRLVAGGRIFTLSALHLARFWRTRIAWWEALA